MYRKWLLLIPLLLFGALVALAQTPEEEQFDPAPNTPEENWCYEGGPWGDGRCADSDPFVQQYNWTMGWIMARCDADIFAEDNLPQPCQPPEPEDDEAPFNPGSPFPESNSCDLASDTDGDGLCDDDEELVYGTDPNNADTDMDALGDGEEVLNYGTNPLRADRDADGLGDGSEVWSYGTDPNNADTDADGYTDYEEVTAGSDPLDPNSTP